MRRRITVVPTLPGEGRIAVSILTRRVLEAAGIGVEQYVMLVRSGALDPAWIRTKFDSTPEAMKRYEATKRDLPPLPALRGEVTWRRKERRWSLDVHAGCVVEGVTWNEAVPKGSPSVSLSVSGVVLPESALAKLEGRPLGEALDHPAMLDERMLIAGATSYEPVSLGAFSNPGATQFKVHVPREEWPDPEIASGDERIEGRTS